MFGLFRRKSKLERIARKEFSRMSLFHKRDRVLTFYDGSGIEYVEYYSDKISPWTFCQMLLNSTEDRIDNLEPKTAYLILLRTPKADRGKGYGRELVEAQERIAGRTGITTVNLSNPFLPDEESNRNPEFWQHMGYENNQKQIA